MQTVVDYPFSNARCRTVEAAVRSYCSDIKCTAEQVASAVAHAIKRLTSSDERRAIAAGKYRADFLHARGGRNG